MQNFTSSWFCATCRKQQEHRVQSRVVSTPNVLLVRVPRFDEHNQCRRFKLEAEEELSLPGMSEMQLFGVVYYDGKALGEKDGRYICLCRGPDWRFWSFNGRERPSRLPEHISHFKKDCSCLLVYTRPGGESMFAGALSLPEKIDYVKAPGKDADAVRSAVQGVAKATLVPKLKVDSTSDDGQKNGEAAASTLADSADFAKFVASAYWKCCLKCGRKWRENVEIEAFPADKEKKGAVIVHFTCDKCIVLHETTADEAREKKRRLSDSAGEGEELWMDAPPNRTAEVSESRSKLESAAAASAAAAAPGTADSAATAPEVADGEATKRAAEFAQGSPDVELSAEEAMKRRRKLSGSVAVF
jgi:hypothetical protein